MSGIFNARKLRNIELNRLSVDDFKANDKFPIHVVLDNVRSMHNVGSVFRTSDAFNVACIHLCGITAQPPHRDITRSAIGAELSVNWKYHTSTSICLEELKKEGVRIICVEQMEPSTRLEHLEIQREATIALVFGNEVDGVAEEVLPLCDDFVEIPQFGTKHSLNISVCAGVVLWEIAKRHIEA
ncbi:MAG: 23S rRNA (guanosine2251-2'-O)-methyltransferase [Bacteroidia bacterium]|jgi:23S rRNA (guanosine2251-2'-O)-methyltransferase